MSRERKLQGKIVRMFVSILTRLVMHAEKQKTKRKR